MRGAYKRRQQRRYDKGSGICKLCGGRLYIKGRQRSIYKDSGFEKIEMSKIGNNAPVGPINRILAQFVNSKTFFLSPQKAKRAAKNQLIFTALYLEDISDKKIIK